MYTCIMYVLWKGVTMAHLGGRGQFVGVASLLILTGSKD